MFHRVCSDRTAKPPRTYTLNLLHPSQFPFPKGFIIVYSIIDKQSWAEAQKLVDHVSKFFEGKKTKCIVVAGNKCVRSPVVGTPTS